MLYPKTFEDLFTCDACDLAPCDVPCFDDEQSDRRAHGDELDPTVVQFRESGEDILINTADLEDALANAWSLYELALQRQMAQAAARRLSGEFQPIERYDSPYKAEERVRDLLLASLGTLMCQAGMPLIIREKLLSQVGYNLCDAF
jgi:hypothetical protein